MLTIVQLNAIRSTLDKSDFVQRAWLFGSFARNQESLDSDVDIMFEKIPGSKFGLIKLSTLIGQLENALGKRVDFIYRPSMIDEVAEDADKDKRIVYERK